MLQIQTLMTVLIRCLQRVQQQLAMEQELVAATTNSKALAMVLGRMEVLLLPEKQMMTNQTDPYRY